MTVLCQRHALEGAQSRCTPTFKDVCTYVWSVCSHASKSCVNLLLYTRSITRNLSSALSLCQSTHPPGLLLFQPSAKGAYSTASACALWRDGFFFFCESDCFHWKSNSNAQCSSWQASSTASLCALWWIHVFLRAYLLLLDSDVWSTDTLGAARKHLAQ